MSTVANRRDGAVRTRNKPATPGAPFQSELEKAQVGGYASLDGTSGLIPASQLGTGTPDATTALFGDQTFKAAATAASLATETAARISADSSEASTRASADTTLQTNITNEASTRASADTTESAARVTHQNLTTTAHGGIVASTDSRLTDSRAPNGSAGGDLTGTYPSPTVALLAITDAKVAAANKDGVAGTASMRTLGTGALQACAGNDSRLSDKRLPLPSTNNVTASTGVPTTALALGAISINGERWEVSIGASTFGGGIMVIVCAMGAAWTIYVVGSTGGVTASMSGNNLQITQATGVNQTFDVRGVHIV